MTRNMISRFLLWLACTILILFCFIIAASAQQDSTGPLRPVHLGLIFPLSTNGMEAPNCTNFFSLHAIAGVSRQENAFCLSGVSSVIKEDAKGALISGIYNHVGHNARGAQIAGVVNVIRKDTKGVQIAGVVNVSTDVKGAQVAGLANVAQNVNGAQVAGFANSSKYAGVQVAGFSNVTRQSDALQLAGFINVAKEAKTQVGGFMNIAGKVKGVQISGLINIAAESDYPVGLINLIKNGEQQLGISADETGTTLLTFRSGSKVLYGIIGFGYNFKDDPARYVLEGGMGAHFYFSKYFRTNLEITTAALTDLRHNVYMKSSTKLLAALRIAKRIELFAGPSFNYLGYERGQVDIRNGYLWKERTRDHVNGLYIGATGGIQVSL